MRCVAVTRRGSRCRVDAEPGWDLCHVHVPREEFVRRVEMKRAAKAKKAQKAQERGIVAFSDVPGGPDGVAGSDASESAPGGSPGPGVVELWTDGSCSGNPGPGGWGALLLWNGMTRELFGGAAMTTNNRMELRAAIEGLAALNRPSRVQVFTDSRYVRDGMVSWVPGWESRGWVRGRDRSPIPNTDLWQALLAVSRRHAVEWVWVRGHAGVPGNERADRLAALGLDGVRGGGLPAGCVPADLVPMALAVY